MSYARPMQKITPFLWFDSNAEEAVNLYISVFSGGRITTISRYGKHGPFPEGTAMSIEFELEGQGFMALNGGPHFKFTEAISLFVRCETQEEVDRMWDALCAGGGEPQRCGWLKDRFGVSWQIIPRALGELMSQPDRQKAGRVMQAMLQMGKIDIAVLKKAAEG